MNYLFPDPDGLPVLRLRFAFRTPTRIKFANYPGELFRTLFGNALARLCCKRYQSVEKIVCTECPHRFECGYHILFKPLNPDTTNKRFTHIPAPLVLSPAFSAPAVFERGDVFAIDATIIGNKVKYLPLIVKVMKMMARIGFFDTRIHPVLTAITNITDPKHAISLFDGASFLTSKVRMMEIRPMLSLPDYTARITVRLLTPLSLIYKNKRSSVLTFAMMWQRVLDRAILLTEQYGNMVLHKDTIEYTKELSKEIPTVYYRIKSETYYKSSSVSSYGIPVMSGKITFANVPSAFLPLLKLGELIHIGSNTAMGFGKYYLMVRSSRHNNIFQSRG